MNPTSSRMADLSPPFAWWVVGMLALALVTSLWFAQQAAPIDAQPAAQAQSTDPKQDEDLLLYERIISRVAAGTDYHEAAITEQRNANYPVRPFVTIRLPTLAVMIAYLGFPAAQMLVMSIAGAALLAWRHRLLSAGCARSRAMVLVLILASGLTPVATRHYVTLHEIWAGALIALSLGLHSPKSWFPSLLVAAVALAVRELTVPFVLLMLAVAAYARRYSEMAAWALLLLCYGIALAAHADAISALVGSHDPSSPPWVQFGGLGAAFDFAWKTSVFRGLSPFLAFPLITLSLFGWLSWRSETGMISSLLILGYLLAFALTGRSNNFYWGLMIAPLLAVGLGFVVPALSDLSRVLRAPKLDSSPV